VRRYFPEPAERTGFPVAASPASSGGESQRLLPAVPPAAQPVAGVVALPSPGAVSGPTVGVAHGEGARGRDAGLPGRMPGLLPTAGPSSGQAESGPAPGPGAVANPDTSGGEDSATKLHFPRSSLVFFDLRNAGEIYPRIRGGFDVLPEPRCRHRCFSCRFHRAKLTPRPRFSGNSESSHSA